MLKSLHNTIANFVGSLFGVAANVIFLALYRLLLSGESFGLVAFFYTLVPRQRSWVILM